MMGRAELIKLNALRLSNLNKITLKEAVQSKQAMKAAISKLKSREVNDMYTEQYRESEIAKAKQTHQNNLAAIGAEVDAKLVEMQSSIEEINSELADRDAVKNTAEIIKATGKDLDDESLRKLVAPFAQDQLGLRVLQAACKSAGLAYDGGISTMLYDTGSLFSQAREAGRAAFFQQGSINSFASKVAKIAKYHGVEFDSNPDPGGFEEAMLKGAGLPMPE